MSAETEMFIGFLIVEWVVFLPIITIGIIGYLASKCALKKIDQELEDLEP